MQWSCLTRLLGVFLLATANHPWFALGAGGSEDKRRIVMRLVSGFADQPLAGQRITVTPIDFRGGRPLEMISDAGGLIELSTTSSHDAWPAWQFLADGFLPAMMDLSEVLSETDHWHGQLKLHRSSTGGGRVMDDDGKPVAGAQVAVIINDDAGSEWYEPRRFHFETTDSEGRWICAHLPEAGVAGLRVVHPDYAPLLTVASDGPPGRSSHRFEEVTSRRAVMFLQRGIRIRGRVVDARGDPVEGVRVWSGHYPVWTPADGRFTLLAAPDAPFHVRMHKEGHGLRTGQIDVAAAPAEVSFTLEPMPLRRMTVLDDAGKRLAGVLARVVDPRHGLETFQRTDVDGGIALEGGDLKVSIYRPGFRLLKETNVAANTLEATVRLQPLSRLSLRVLRDEAGEPVGEFQVTPGIVDEGGVTWLPDRATQAGDGEVSLRFDPSVRSVRLAVAAAGRYRHVTPPITMTEAGAAMEVRLRRQEPVFGVVRDANGPVAGVRVVAIPEGAHASLGRGGSLEAPAEWAGFANDEGKFQLLPPAPAAWVAATHEEKGFQVESLGEDRGSIEMVLEAWAEVTGVVQWEGRPAPGQLVALGSRGGEPIAFNANAYVVRADSQGRFNMRYVPVGSHLLGKWNSMSLTHGELIEVLPGARLAIAFPQLGWRVTGEARLPGITLDWSLGSHLAKLRRRGSEGSTLTTYDLTLAADGAFSVTDVPPGAFELVIHFHEATPQGTGVVCRYRLSSPVDLPPLPSGPGPAIRELGPLWLRETPAGDAAGRTPDE